MMNKLYSVPVYKLSVDGKKNEVSLSKIDKVIIKRREREISLITPMEDVELLDSKTLRKMTGDLKEELINNLNNVGFRLIALSDDQSKEYVTASEACDYIDGLPSSNLQANITKLRQNKESFIKNLI